LCAGDFNEILDPSEISSSGTRPPNQMAVFREALLDCDLTDLGYHGFPFTWSNKRKYPATVRARLDRAVCSASWRILFPNASVQHLPFGGSDHAPILIGEDTHMPNRWPQRLRRFRFEAYWTDIPGCEESIREGWTLAPQRRIPMGGRLGRTRARLLYWYRRTTGPLKAAIHRIEHEIALLAHEDISEENWNREKALKVELNSLLMLEESYWKQRSKAHWLINGDRNTAFFHAHASRRRSTNRIHMLRTDDGHLLETETEIHSEIAEYFKRMFTSSEPDEESTREVLSSIPTRLSPTMISTLLMPFTTMEIERAVKDMKPMTSPGPDDFPSLFFQRYWHIVKHEVMSTVLTVLNEGRMEQGLNHTHIVLIPKVATPETISQYRPISLCNVVYKI
ncbi:hypothetical protein M569_14134, partial [Genlisea aurea]